MWVKVKSIYSYAGRLDDRHLRHRYQGPTLGRHGVTVAKRARKECARHLRAKVADRRHHGEATLAVLRTENVDVALLKAVHVEGRTCCCW